MSKIKKSKCTIDFVDLDIVLFIGDREEFNRKIADSNDLERAADYNSGACWMVIKKYHKRDTIFLWAHKKKKSTILHEVSHAIDTMFSTYQFSSADTELRAYLLEYIYRNLTNCSE